MSGHRVVATICELSISAKTTGILQIKRELACNAYIIKSFNTLLWPLLPEYFNLGVIGVALSEENLFQACLAEVVQGDASVYSLPLMRAGLFSKTEIYETNFLYLPISILYSFALFSVFRLLISKHHSLFIDISVFLLSSFSLIFLPHLIFS